MNAGASDTGVSLSDQMFVKRTRGPSERTATIKARGDGQ